MTKLTIAKGFNLLDITFPKTLSAFEGTVHLDSFCRRGIKGFTFGFTLGFTLGFQLPQEGWADGVDNEGRGDGDEDKDKVFHNCRLYVYEIVTRTLQYSLLSQDGRCSHLATSRTTCR